MEKERRPLFATVIDKEAPVDEGRVAFIEKVVSRLARRTNKSATVLISPYPISNAVFGEKVDGIVLSYMFPCGGRITKGAVDLGKKPKQDISVVVSLMGEETGESKTFVLTKRRLTMKPDIEVKTFDRLEVSISYEAVKPEDNLTEFWASLLWVPTIKDVVAKSFLIDELENDILQEQE